MGAKLMCTAMLVLAAGVLVSATLAQGGDERSPTAFQHVNALASRARSQDKAAVRAVTDAILDRVSPISIPEAHSLRERVFRAEDGFRHGRHGVISEEALVSAMNDLASAIDAPKWAKTNQAQVRLFRTMLKPHVPQLVGTQPGGVGRYGLASEMSPAETVLVALALVSAKATQPSFKLEPDQWVESVRSATRQRPAAARRPIKGRLVGRIVDPEETTFRLAVEDGLKDESSSVSQQAHAFFDRLGIAQ